MAQLTRFNQEALLTGVTDPVLRGGICVALCDLWLALIKGNTARTPQERMAALRARAPQAMAYQKSYARQRASQGREAARAIMGQTLGHDYEGQTVVMRSFVGMEGIRERMARDLAAPGAAATWTMAMPGVGRHAIAGYRGLVSLAHNMHRASLHVFDPNLGEYVGEPQELDLMLRDLFRRIPDYALVTELSRSTTG